MLTSQRTTAGARGVLLAACLLVASHAQCFASPARAGSPPPSVYVIEGYLDRAPKDARILDRIDISANGRRHTLLVTRFGAPGETRLGRRLSWAMAASFTLRGTPEEVDRLADARSGAKVAGTFAAYTGTVPWLLIVNLAAPPPAS